MRKTIRQLMVVALVLVSAPALFAAEVKKSPEQVRYEAVLERAEKARDSAAAVGGEWRDIRKMLKRAKRAANRGNYAKAQGLAEKAEFQAKMGRAQALSQRGIGLPNYMR